MVLLYSMLQGVEFSVTPGGFLGLKCSELGEGTLGELGITAISADKPEEIIPVKIKMVRQEGAGLSFVAESPILSIEGDISPAGEPAHFRIGLRIINRAVPGAYSLTVKFLTPCLSEPRFMVPGIFYKYNRPKTCTRKYPAFSLNPEENDPFSSNHWAFRSDRCAEPAILAWKDNLSCALATSAVFDKGQSGVFFNADGENLEIGLHYPYREEPVKYSFCYESGNTPECTFFYLKRGEDFTVKLDFCIDRPDIHSYAGFFRKIYKNEHNTKPTHPWMDSDHTNELLAEGLFKWHYDNHEEVLWETCAFDKYFGKDNTYVDRKSMHVAWISGAPAAMALLWHGRDTKNEEYIDAGLRVLNKIASGISPSGTFFPCWEAGKGWTGGWNPEPNLAQARTSAEATLFLLRAIRRELVFDETHPDWVEAVRKNLDFAVSIQRDDGNLGSYYTIDTGEVSEWEGAGGLLWIAPLIGASVLFDEEKYREAAVRAGDYYSRFIEDEFLYGAPEDVHLTPTSEDGYNALISYLLLSEITHEERWFKLAVKAADWLLTFRFSYNTRFPQHSILQVYNFHTKGGDVASPSNQHLHSYGLVCHPELIRLAEYLDDDYYKQRATEHLEFCHQFIARTDGDFGARRGMVPEQFYHTDWWQPKGHLLSLAHTWCAGLILYANLWEKNIMGESSVRLKQTIFSEPETDSGPSAKRSLRSRTPTEELPPSERETLFDL